MAVAPSVKKGDKLIPHTPFKDDNLVTVALRRDAIAHLKDALKKYDIRGFPTIKLFRKGQTFEYSGNRLAASFVDFVKSHM